MSLTLAGLKVIIAHSTKNLDPNDSDSGPLLMNIIILWTSYKFRKILLLNKAEFYYFINFFYILFILS